MAQRQGHHCRAGTVLKPRQLEEALDAGAKFIVTPGFQPGGREAGPEASVPVFPGVATATEIQMALDQGVEVVRFFPAEAMGGVATLKALAGRSRWCVLSPRAA